jgi:hypothetical protein
MNKSFSKFVFADSQYNDYKESVTIDDKKYKLFFQREITDTSGKIEEALCVNCFEFITVDESDSYLLMLGFDGKYGMFSFGFRKKSSGDYFSMDNILTSIEEYPLIKEMFRGYFENSYHHYTNPTSKFDDFGETLYSLFDYCYAYLMEKGFHISDIK